MKEKLSSSSVGQLNQAEKSMVAAKDFLKWKEFVAEMLGMQILFLEMLGMKTFEALQKTDQNCHFLLI